MVDLLSIHEQRPCLLLIAIKTVTSAVLHQAGHQWRRQQDYKYVPPTQFRDSLQVFGVAT